MKRIGAWLIGARGTMASAVVLGARAIAKGLAGRTGLVTETPDLKPLPLAEPDQVVFGGWDIAPTGLLDRARALAYEDRAISPDLVEALRADLEAVEGQVRPGYAEGSGPAISRLVKAKFLPRGGSLEAA